MFTRITRSVVPILLLAAAAIAPSARADNYAIDAAHTSVDADPAKCSFAATIKANSLMTGQKKRDDHLKSPDFLNANQFPEITFKNTKVEAMGSAYLVTGDLTLHGVTKPITLHITKGGEAEFPKGTQRVGFTTSTTLKRSDFGVSKFLDMVGDETKLTINFEATKQ
jgi:polyisoprenoid-binding protein YceI